MKGLDFKDWEKVKSDKKSTTLRHKKGHSMTIAHSALPKIQQEQLKRLKMADGGEVPSQDASPPSSDDSSSSPDHSTTININAAPAGGVPNAPPGGASGSWDSSPSVTQPVVTRAPAAVPANTPLESQASSTLGGVGTGIQAAKGQIPIEEEKAKIAGQGEGQLAENAQNAAKQYQVAYADISKHADDFNQYMMKNPIRPNAYLEDMKAGEKTATAIGLLLGGFSTPFTHQANPAMTFLNEQINRNVSAQQQNAENHKTIWGAYQHLYEDNNVATKLATASTAEVIAHQIAQKAAKFGGAQAAVNAKLAISNLLNTSTQNRMDAAGLLNDKANRGAALPQQPGAQGAVLEPSGQTSNRILKPGADQTMSTIQYHPEMKSDLDKAHQQYTLATQADKALAQLDQVYPNLVNERTWGGWASRHINPHGMSALGGGIGAIAGSVVPGLGTMMGAGAGAGVGEGLGQAVKSVAGGALGGNPNKQYESDKVSVYGLLSGVLKGIVPDETLRDIVDKNSPEKLDNQATILKKKQNIENFIKDHVPTDVLKRRGMTN